MFQSEEVLWFGRVVQNVHVLDMIAKFSQFDCLLSKYNLFKSETSNSSYQPQFSMCFNQNKIKNYLRWDFEAASFENKMNSQSKKALLDLLPNLPLNLCRSSEVTPYHAG